ncbi:hypothetical protein LTR66_010848 [Elasticomyces elasticus]|nr:hypothetical protein LTR66_010848 [Elasticomyces elasticus]
MERSFNHPDLPYLPNRPLRGDARTAPLAQTEWADLPLPYRPVNWSERCRASSTPPFAWRLRPPPQSHFPGEPPLSGQSSESRKTRAKRLRSLIPVLGNASEERGNQARSQTSFLIPSQPHTWAHFPDPISSGIMDFDLRPRAVSQPNTPSWTAADRQYSDFTEYDSQPLRIPREPRLGTAEEAFTDERELHLFAAATSGVSPDQDFAPQLSHHRRPSSTSCETRNLGAQSRGNPELGAFSPVNDTPTTVYARQTIGSLPGAFQTTRADLPDSTRRISYLQLEPDGEFDPWQDPTAAQLRVRPDAFDADDESVSTVEDEPPNYVQSQLEAARQARRKAAARAEELQRRWVLSGGPRR